MWYREGIARTSGETNFSGVHKGSLAAQGFGARPLASPSPTDAKTNSCKQDPARQLTRFSREKIKYIKNIKLKEQALPGRTNGVRLLLDRWLAIARRACLCMV